MTLEDFEKSLVEENKARDAEESRKRRKYSHRHHHYRHHHHDRSEDETHGSRRSKYRKRHGENGPGAGHVEQSESNQVCEEEDEWVEKVVDPACSSVSSVNVQGGLPAHNQLKRDTWMEKPSSLDIDYTQKGAKKPPPSTNNASAKADFELKIHDNELNKHHLQTLADGKITSEDGVHSLAQHEVDYVFGDSGAQWRMTRLKAVYRRAEETGMAADDVALEQYGGLRVFDDAREEETELERRATYGDGYKGKERPSGELFQQRKLEMGVRNDRKVSIPEGSERAADPLPTDTEIAPSKGPPVDQTTLNRLKAQMMKAKLKSLSEARSLELKYNEALEASRDPPNPQTVVLGAMHDRMLAGGRRGEVKPIDTKRGRERGLVEQNEDMSIEDMVREERRTRNQAGGDGQRFAERIAKDAKFDVRRYTMGSRTPLANLTGRTIWNTWTKMPRNWQSVFRSRRST